MTGQPQSGSEFSPLKIALVLQELNPFITLTPQAETSLRLIQWLAQQGHELRIFMPRFGVINERKFRLHEVIRLSGVHINVMDEDFPMLIKVAPLAEVKRMQIYFVDHEEFFARKFIFVDDEKKFFPDNAARAVFYSKGTLAAMRILGWIPDIIHIQGWFAATAPLVMKTFYRGEPFVEESKTILEITDGQFIQQPLGTDFIEVLSMDEVPEEYLAFLKDPKVGDLYTLGAGLADLTLWNPHRKRGMKTYHKLIARHAKRFEDIFQKVDPQQPQEIYYPLYQELAASRK